MPRFGGQHARATTLFPNLALVFLWALIALLRFFPIAHKRHKAKANFALQTNDLSLFLVCIFSVPVRMPMLVRRLSGGRGDEHHETGRKNKAATEVAVVPRKQKDQENPGGLPDGPPKRRQSDPPVAIASLQTTGSREWDRLPSHYVVTMAADRRHQRDSRGLSLQDTHARTLHAPHRTFDSRALFNRRIHKLRLFVL
jgi:hypothetical protein